MRIGVLAVFAIVLCGCSQSEKTIHERGERDGVATSTNSAHRESVNARSSADVGTEPSTKSKADGLAETKSDSDASPRLSDADRLLKQVRSLLPKGWKARIIPAETPAGTRIHERPMLQVERVAMAEGLFHYPSASGEERKPQLESIAFTFSFEPYVAPTDWHRHRRENQVKDETRRKAMKRLKGIRFGYKGNPIPPDAYEPKNEAEKALVREYAVIWEGTKPVKLPDYVYGKLSMRGYLMNAFIAEHRAVRDEIDGVRDAILAIMQYPEPE